MIGELITTGYTYHDGRVAINDAFSAQTSFNILSASTLNISNVLSGTPVLNLAVDVFGNVVSANGFQAPTPFQTLIYAGNIVWGYDMGSNANTTLSGNSMLSITGISDGNSGTLIVKQDNVGGRALALGGIGTHKIIHGGGGSLLLSSAPNAEDIISFLYMSATTTFYWNIGYNYD